jgi:hypothetical protein
MRKIILLMLMLLPCSAFAGSNCRLIEYPDHYEAICDGSVEQTPASYQSAGQEQAVATDQAAFEAALPNVPPEKIVRNELARLHMASWLKSRHGQ